MIFENKNIPNSWKNKPSYFSILKKVFNNNDEIIKLAITNHKNNEQKEKYNQKLRENLPLLKHQSLTGNEFEYDNDLTTLVNSKRKMKKIIKIPKMMTLNEEYKNMIRKQNKKVEIIRPDSIRQNLKDILNYRKNIAMRFKYNNLNNKYKLNSHLTKSKSQILNSMNNKNRLILYNNKGLANDNIRYSDKKEYEDKLMITGMNNKKYKKINEAIIEEKN